MCYHPVIRGTLWDLDGVIADTEAYHIQALQAAFNDFNLTIPKADLFPFFGTNTEMIFVSIVKEKVNTENKKLFIKKHSDYFCQLVKKNVKPIPGIENLLVFFQHLKMKQAIASSSTNAIIDIILDRLGFRPYFDQIVSGAELPAKPDPTVFLKAAETLSLPPKSCIVIEDSPMGIAAAKSAAMKCIAVTTSRPPSELQQADLIIEDMKNIDIKAVLAMMHHKEDSNN